ncbi:PIG-L family deacetylase [Allosaccharopolyspora coralli]|uniref:PIG-L family deacetylase n=2 Tax=Allosaccharopolyspora coralli TaxID=2665642 RepID=A0A5Q3QBS2_9PSEU|nr:PIG-L family deacetylase [Allosaccharopolyspora coralli]
MPTEWRRALAVVAHPDDLEYGVSGAIAKWTDEGREVSYLLATHGEAGIDALDPADSAEVREREQRAAADAVGVSTVEFLEHRDGVIEYGPALRRDIVAGIRRHRPELVLTINHRDTWGGTAWNTPDHRAVGRATLDACGDAGNRWIFTELIDDGLLPWDGVRWVAVAATSSPTHAVDVSDTVERAVRSLLAHRTYVESISDESPEDYCRSVQDAATGAGAEQFGGVPAVAFELFAR